MLGALSGCCWSRGDRADADDATIVRFGPLSAETLAMILHSPDGKQFKWQYGFFVNRDIRLAFEKHQETFVYRRRVIILTVQAGVSVSTMWWRGAINGPMWYSVLLSICSIASLAFFAALPVMERRARLLMHGKPRVGDALLFICVMFYLLALPGMYLTGANVLDTSGDGVRLPDRATHALRISAFCVVAATGGVFFNPVLALLTGGITAWAYCLRYNRLLDVAVTVGGVEVDVMDLTSLRLRASDFLLHASVALVLVLVHERNALEQFRLECAVQRVAARRIDQLNNEKERIGFELAMEEVRLETFERNLARSLPSRGNSRGEDEHEDDETREQADGDEVASLDTSMPSPKASLSPRSAASLSWGQGRLFHGGASRSAGGSSLGESCDELAGIIDGAGLDVSAPHLRPASKSSMTMHAETPSSRASSSLARPACALPLVQTHDVSVPAPGTKTACVRMEEDLNWPERQQLRAKRMLQPISGRSHAGSDSGSSASGLGGGSLPLTDPSNADAWIDPKGCGWTCLKRERALWRTLHRAGCLGSAASSAGSADSSASDAGALSHAHGKRQAGLPNPCVV